LKVRRGVRGWRGVVTLLITLLVGVSLVEAVLAISVDGVAKHWILSSCSEMKEMGGYIVEEKSQTLDLPSPPLSLASYCYQGTHCTVLVVCKEVWQVGVARCVGVALYCSVWV
jgi:hypothetical protein